MASLLPMHWVSLMPAASLQVTGPTFNPLLLDRQAGTLENDGAEHLSCKEG